jgi:uncharacterized Zn finger protein
MKAESLWAHYFKPEVRKAGEDLAGEGAVHISIAGDTQIQAYVRASKSLRVSLTSSSISSPVFQAGCSCPPFSKGQLCKHIWATILAAEEKAPDFFDSKTEVERLEATATEAAGSAKGDRHKSSWSQKPTPKPPTEAQIRSQEAFKAKQSEYRKQQYQKQKERLKEPAKDGKASVGGKFAKPEKRTSKFAAPTPQYPEDVQKALDYFADNGFTFEGALDIEALRNARKILARVFHPDKGGTHEEILALNENFDILAEYQGS